MTVVDGPGAALCGRAFALHAWRGSRRERPSARTQTHKISGSISTIAAPKCRFLVLPCLREPFWVCPILSCLFCEHGHRRQKQRRSSFLRHADCCLGLLPLPAATACRHSLPPQSAATVCCIRLLLQSAASIYCFFCSWTCLSREGAPVSSSCEAFLSTTVLCLSTMGKVKGT